MVYQPKKTTGTFTCDHLSFTGVQSFKYPPPELTPFPSIERILQVAAEVCGVPVEMLKSKSRKREYVIARRTAIYILHTRRKMSLKAIGLELGGRDHTTVISSLRDVQNWPLNGWWHYIEKTESKL